MTYEEFPLPQDYLALPPEQELNQPNESYGTDIPEHSFLAEDFGSQWDEHADPGTDDNIQSRKSDYKKMLVSFIMVLSMLGSPASSSDIQAPQSTIFQTAAEKLRAEGYEIVADYWLQYQEMVDLHSVNIAVPR